MSANLASQAVATAFLDKWCGDGVKKDAFLQKRVGGTIAGGVEKGVAKLIGAGEAVGAAGMKGLSGYFGNSAAAGGASTASSKIIGGLRSAAGVRSGQAAFEKPLDYVSRPLRAALLPNIGRPLNALRTGLLGGFIGQQGYKGYELLGEGADKMKGMADTAWNLGASEDVVSDMNRYSTRGGILQGWLRGRGVNLGPLTGSSTTGRQQIMDKAVAEGATDAAYSHLSGAMNSDIHGFEVLNPVGSLVRRGIETGIGSAGKEETGGWTEDLARSFRDFPTMNTDQRLQAAKDMFSKAKSSDFADGMRSRLGVGQ